MYVCMYVCMYDVCKQSSFSYPSPMTEKKKNIAMNIYKICCVLFRCWGVIDDSDAYNKEITKYSLLE